MLSLTLRLPRFGDVRVTQTSVPEVDPDHIAVDVVVNGDQMRFVGDRYQLAGLFRELEAALLENDPDRSWTWGGFYDGSEPF